MPGAEKTYSPSLHDLTSVYTPHPARLPQVQSLLACLLQVAAAHCAKRLGRAGGASPLAGPTLTSDPVLTDVVLDPGRRSLLRLPCLSVLSSMGGIPPQLLCFVVVSCVELEQERSLAKR